MKKTGILFIILLFTKNVFSSGEKPLVQIGLNKYSHKVVLGDSAWNRMKYLDEYPNPTITIQFGGMWLNNNAELRLNSDRLGTGTTINLKNDLGINPGAFAPTGELRLRIGKRHQIVASALGYSRSKSKTLERTFQFDDTTFYANAFAKAKMRFIAYNLDYRFSILRSARGELGLSVGAKLYDIYGSIEAGINSSQIDYSERKRVFAPALLPGIHGSYYLTKNILVRAKAEYLKLTVSDWKFNVIEIKPSLEFYPIPNLGIGASYSYYHIQVTREDSELLDGSIKYIINGASVFASLRF